MGAFGIARRSVRDLPRRRACAAAMVGHTRMDQLVLHRAADIGQGLGRRHRVQHILRLSRSRGGRPLL